MTFAFKLLCYGLQLYLHHYFKCSLNHQ